MLAVSADSVVVADSGGALYVIPMHARRRLEVSVVVSPRLIPRPAPDGLRVGMSVSF